MRRFLRFAIAPVGMTRKKNNAPQNDEKKGRNKQEENLFLLSGVKNLKVLLEIA